MGRRYRKAKTADTPWAREKTVPHMALADAMATIRSRSTFSRSHDNPPIFLKCSPGQTTGTSLPVYIVE